MKTTKKKVDLLVVIPFGPNDTAAETIESIQAYCGPSHAIVVMDDTRDNQTEGQLKALGDDVYVVKAPEGLPTGTYGGLYLKTLHALRWANEHFEFKAALRLDTDSLIVGARPERDAIEMFAKDPTYGLLGSYRKDCNGTPRGTSGVTKRLLAEIYAGWIQHPSWSWTLYKIHRTARKNGYVNGDHCLGAAIFMRPEFIAALTADRLAGSLAVQYCGLGDDHIYGFMSAYLGFTQVDFAPDPLPLGISGKGLPDTPENLIKRGKKIVHSVKPKDVKVRRYFKQLREAAIERKTV